MSTETYDQYGNPIEPEDHQQQESANVRQMRERIKALEAEAAAKTELEAKIAGYERNDALRAAGLELDEKRRKALEAVHDGDWTAEKLRETAVTLGFAQPPQPDTPPAEVQAHQQMQAAASGGNVGIPDRDAELDAKLVQARSADEFMELYRQSGRLIAP